MQLFHRHESGFLNSTGEGNTFLGHESGKQNDTGSGNVFLGYHAGFANTTGMSNIFIGRYAGDGNSTGNYNIALGDQSGRSYMGDGNTYLGFGAQPLNKFVSYSTAIGFGSRVNCDSCMVLGGEGYYTVKVGIGTFTPTARLDIRQNSIQSMPHIRISEVADSADYARLELRNQGDAAYWHIAGRTTSTATEEPRLHFFFHNGSTGYDNILSIDGKNKWVGINRSNPDEALHVMGNAEVSGNIYASNFPSPSDRRFKRQVEPVRHAGDLLARLEGVRYAYRTEEFPGRGLPEGHYLGLIAQDVENVLPELVVTRPDGYKSLIYDGLIPVLVEAWKEDQQTTKQMQREIDLLREENDALRARLDRLEQLIGAGNSLQEADLTGPVARLFQNEPNPFDEDTLIRYELPPHAGTAHLRITNVSGIVLETIPIEGQGLGEVRLHAGRLAPGVYVYSLLINGQVMDSKKMVLR